MIKDNLVAVSNVSVYGAISFVIFFTVFLFVAVMIIKSRKEVLDEINRIPLSDNTQENNTD